MNNLFYILIFIFLSNSCSNKSSQEQTISDSSLIKAINIISNDTSKKYDNIKVTFWNDLAMHYMLEYNKRELKLYCDENKLYIKVNDSNQVNQFVNLVTRFYVEKQDNIILSRKKRNYIRATDYPLLFINVKSKNNKMIVDERTQIGDEIYDVVYHPDFLRFYELVQEVTSSCGK